MNRLTAKALADEAESGKHVLVLSGGLRISRNAFDETIAAARDRISKTRRANGQEQIEIGKGRIDFRSIRSNLNGISADLLFIDWVAEIELRELDRWADMRAIVASSPTGEIIRA